jgi:gas vesicle protein
MRRDYDDSDDDLAERPYVVVEKQSGGGLLSFVAGIAVGAAIAILFAPEAGADTRRSIARRARRVRQAARDAVDGLAEKVGDTVGAAKQRVEDKIGEARGAFDAKRDQVHRAMDAGRDAAREARQDLERRLEETKAAYQAGAQVARDARKGSRQDREG